MWYNYAIFTLALVAAGFQVWGAHLVERPCKYYKYAYAFTLSIASLFVFLMEIVEESEFGYAMALVVVLFHILIGAVARVVTIKRGNGCEH
jgi:C4-dicarboxylate transporter